jgi:hypothetical protein
MNINEINEARSIAKDIVTALGGRDPTGANFPRLKAGFSAAMGTISSISRLDREFDLARVEEIPSDSDAAKMFQFERDHLAFWIANNQAIVSEIGLPDSDLGKKYLTCDLV